MKRSHSLKLFIASILLGLFLRKSGLVSIDFIHPSFGDFIWGIMSTAGFRFILPNKKIGIVIGLSFGVNTLIELSQLVDANWINSLREIPALGFILGSSFLWTDIFAYALGVLPQLGFEYFLKKSNWQSQKHKGLSN